MIGLKAIQLLNKPKMRILWYLLVALFGLYGILAALHTIELLLTGAGFPVTQLLLAIVALLLSGVFLKKARNAIAK
jgi:hypothetical protein